jgi:Rps23 Pro-64 3,4-dihydroxylase Tpa1-like proline 4-hydroxylase
MPRRHTFLRQFHQLLSVDTVLATGVVTGCISLVTLAYLDGRAPLEGSMSCLKMYDTNHNHSNDTTIFRLNSKDCQQLATDGYLVVDDFLTKDQVKAARDCIEWDKFQANANHADDETIIRTDLVYFQTHNTDNDDDIIEGRQNDNRHQQQSSSTCGMQQVQTLLRSVGHTIAISNFAGFQDKQQHNNYNHNSLYVPIEMQVSLYNPGGTYYHAHTDACTDEIHELGLLGYLRSWYLRKRYLTCIVYLNDTQNDWKDEDGGCLRIFHSKNFVNNDDDIQQQQKQNTESQENNQSTSLSAAASSSSSSAAAAESSNRGYTDIKPKSGRMVLFSSTYIYHAVLPTFEPRLACCVWFTMQH